MNLNDGTSICRQLSLTGPTAVRTTVTNRSCQYSLHPHGSGKIQPHKTPAASDCSQLVAYQYWMRDCYVASYITDARRVSFPKTDELNSSVLTKSVLKTLFIVLTGKMYIFLLTQV